MCDLPVTKEECNGLACIAYNGFVRVVQLADSSLDSSTVFVLSTALEKEEKISQTLYSHLGSVSAELVAEVTIRTVAIANRLVWVSS